jgi:peptidoglycan/LPS O-acetylase OafA/YrhL
LYFFVVGLLVLVVAIVSDFSLREPLLNVLRQIVCWSSFTVLGGPDINMVERTTLILAGVTWSLPYEWMFYLLLPLLFLMRGGWPGWPWLLLGLAAIGVSIVRPPASGSFYPVPWRDRCCIAGSLAGIYSAMSWPACSTAGTGMFDWGGNRLWYCVSDSADFVVVDCFCDYLLRQ